eukprot:UN00450
MAEYEKVCLCVKHMSQKPHNFINDTKLKCLKDRKVELETQIHDHVSSAQFQGFAMDVEGRVCHGLFHDEDILKAAIDEIFYENMDMYGFIRSFAHIHACETP